MKRKEFKQLLELGSPVTYADDRIIISIEIEGKLISIDYIISTDYLEVEVWSDESTELEVTDWMLDMIDEKIKAYILEEQDSMRGAFTQDDYDHFENLINQ